MYDQLPYKRNADLCGEQNIAMYSGHVIKYYMCDNKEKQFAVDNHDEQIKDILAQIEAASVVKPNADDVEDISSNEPDGISQEQIQTLLDDKHENENTSESISAEEFNSFGDVDADDNEPNPSIPTVDAFAGIEDW